MSNISLFHFWYFLCFINDVYSFLFRITGRLWVWRPSWYIWNSTRPQPWPTAHIPAPHHLPWPAVVYVAGTSLFWATTTHPSLSTFWGCRSYVMGLIPALRRGREGYGNNTTWPAGAGSRGLMQKLYAMTTWLRIHLLRFCHTSHLWWNLLILHPPPLCCCRCAGGGCGSCSSRWPGRGQGQPLGAGLN